MSLVYFISDTHFGHKNILKWRRQFDDIDHHNSYIMQNWNAVVKPRDVVYHLGDFSFRIDRHEVNWIASQLQGQIRIMPGNHDQILPTTPNVSIVNEGLRKYKKCWLSHCPIHPDELRGKINLHGHVHSKTILNQDTQWPGWKGSDPRYVNLSCENINYTPILFSRILDKL